MNAKTPSVDDGGTASDREARFIHPDTGTRASRGVDALRGRARRLTARARRFSGSAADYVEGEPMKAILIAFAVGAALGAVLSLMRRSREEG
jgi:ElaB/YqjD/DUF883 family membrane-anchored ribosome-binding protein